MLLDEMLAIILARGIGSTPIPLLQSKDFHQEDIALYTFRETRKHDATFPFRAKYRTTPGSPNSLSLKSNINPLYSVPTQIARSKSLQSLECGFVELWVMPTC